MKLFVEGAGKTTFIDILAGRKNTGIVSGDIIINGKPRTKSFKRIAGYTF
jgi:ABC-type multidrug transport system ATPase subunit